MPHHLLDPLAADDLDRRAAHREAHRTLAWAAADRGELVPGKALDAPVEQAVTLFRGDTPAGAEAFARTDPEVTWGLVAAWGVRRWTTVVGAEAACPVRPAA